MQFLISTQELNAMLTKIQNVVASKNTIPILSNFLIEAVNGKLTLTATDLTVGIECSTEVKVLADGATTIPAKKFSQLIRELTVANVEIACLANEITEIIAGSSRFKINGMNKSEFPTLPNLSSALQFHMKQADLKDMLRRTAFAVSKDDNRYVLTGVLMTINNGIATFTSTDGKRLARSHIAINVPESTSCQIIIPLKAVDEIMNNLNDEKDEDALIHILADKLAVYASGSRIVTKLLSGEYPDVSKVIPEKFEMITTLHREELISLLRQTSLFTDISHSVKFSFSHGELHLMANAKDVGEGAVSMPVNYNGPTFNIAFNCGFFLDILRHCKNETVTMGLTDPYNPVIIADQDSPEELVSSQASPLYMIMPMRLSE